MAENPEKPTVLLVEDIAAQRKAIRNELEHDQFDVTECENAADAIRILDKRQFDIVISDLRMEAPDSGLAVARAGQMRSLQFPGLDTVFIVYTAYPSYSNCVATVKAGGYDYISKTEDDAIGHLIRACREGLSDKREWAGSPDAEFVRAHWSQLLEKYGEVWIAVRGQEVITNAEKLSDLYRELGEKFPRAKPYVVRLERKSAAIV